MPLPKEVLEQLTRDRDEVYVGYYESGEGHTLVFVHHLFSEQAKLYHGGRDWQRFRVAEGAIRQDVLTKAERAWVATCWLASSRRRDQRATKRAARRRRGAQAD